MAQFTNQATVTYNGITANSNIVTGEITQVITARKDSTYDRYKTGDILTYAVNIQNSGATAITGLVITDDLGAYTIGEVTFVPLTHTGDPVLYYINGVLQSAPIVTAGPPLVISGISIPAGLSAALIYRVRVNDKAPLGTGEVIKNTATISGGGLTSTVAATETVNHDPSAALTIRKALSPTSVVENGQLTYTVTLENTGAAAVGAGSGLVVSDTFTPPLASPLAVTLNGAPWAQEGHYNYDPATGAFATIVDQITVPAATFVRNTTTGVWSVNPGVTVLTVTSTI